MKCDLTIERIYKATARIHINKPSNPTILTLTEETPAPVWHKAKGRDSEVHALTIGYFIPGASMNSVFFDHLDAALAPERLDPYRQDAPDPAVTLGRYVLNMAVCESLYTPLQIAEIALRNAIHRQLKVYIFILQR